MPNKGCLSGSVAPNTAADSKIVKPGSLARPPSSNQGSSTRQIIALVLISVPTLIIGGLYDAGHVEACPPSALSLSGLHRSTLATVGFSHLHGH